MTYKSVTVWHKTDKDYKRLLFERASVTQTLAISGSAAAEIENNCTLIRIYTLFDCGISPGDRICIGYEEALLPPDDSYIISEVTGFFSSSPNLRHYKIKCN